MGAILKQPGVAERVDAVLLADGPHTMYDAPHHIYEPGMEKWVRFAAGRDARREALRAHALVDPDDRLPEHHRDDRRAAPRDVGRQDAARRRSGPRGMREIYESHGGSFHVEGFEGQTEKDHIDHIKGMSETLLPYLRERWSATQQAVAAR